MTGVSGESGTERSRGQWLGTAVGDLPEPGERPRKAAAPGNGDIREPWKARRVLEIPGTPVLQGVSAWSALFPTGSGVEVQRSREQWGSTSGDEEQVRKAYVTGRHY